MTRHVVVMVIYLIGMLLIGVATTKKNETVEDYFVASRKMPLWVNINTIAGCYIGAGATMGIAGMVYNVGIGGTAILVFQVIAMCVMAFIMAERLWKSKALTMADVVETTYDSGTRQIVTILRLIGLMGTTGSQLLAMALIGQVVMKGVSFGWSLLIMTVVIVFYTYSGGLMAVALTDVVQMILNAVGVMILLPLIGLIKIGGWAGIADLPSKMLNFTSPGWSFIATMFVFAVPGVFVSQELWVRMFAAKSPKEAKVAMNVASLAVYLPYAISVAVIGLVGAKLFPGIKSDQLIPYMTDQLLPGLTGSIILSSLVAAVMSGADSMLLIGASNIARDVYQRYINPRASDKQMLRISRLCVPLYGAGAMALAYYAKGIIDLMTKMNTPLTAIGPVILFGFYWKKASPLAAKLALATSVVLGIPMLFMGVKLLGQDPLVITFAASIIVMVVVGLIAPNKTTGAPSKADSLGTRLGG